MTDAGRRIASETPRRGATSLLDELAKLETSALSDVLEGVGLPRQVLDQRIRPLTSKSRLVGVAACALLETRPPGAAPPKSGDYFSTVDDLAEPGRVLVLAVHATDAGAVIGGFMAREYRRRGAAGVVTNGAVRDAAELHTLGLPVFGTGATPRNGAKNLQVRSVRERVSLAGSGGGDVDVHDGDFIVADSDGVVVVPGAVASLVAAASRQLMDVERGIARAMADGLTRIEAMRAHDRFGHLPALRAALDERR